MWAIRSYTDRTCCSNSAASSASRNFFAPAMYSSVTPLTIYMRAVPRTESALAVLGRSPVSMLSATSGRADSAVTFGELAAVDRTISVPVQKNPMGITRGRPSSPL